MKLEAVVDAFKDVGLFETGLLYAGSGRPQKVQRQVADWVRAGKLVQIRRGLYTLPPPNRETNPHPFMVANRLVRASYVSLQMALSYYRLIPEHAAVVTSVTTQRPGRWETPLGRFSYNHIQADFFYGFEYRAVYLKMFAFIATPEKALLDFVSKGFSMS